LSVASTVHEVKLWEEKLLRYTIEHNAAKLNIMRGNPTPQDHEK
jgi:hypothetical protein